jgi:hypothetical protein
MIGLGLRKHEENTFCEYASSHRRGKMKNTILKSKIRRMTLIGAVVAATFFSTAFTAEAKTKVGCYGAGCNGKGPVAMGCERDARTLAKAWNDGVLVELRYSKACNARWARTTNASGQYAIAHAYLGTGSITLRASDERMTWSFMWSRKIRACGSVDYVASVCTAAR